MKKERHSLSHISRRYLNSTLIECVYYMKNIFIILVIAILYSSCSSEKPSTTVTAHGTDSTYVLEIVPKEPTRNSTLQLASRGFELSGAKIEWLIDDKPCPTLVPMQFICVDAAKGSAIQAKATVLGREVMSNVVKIVNIPPEIINVKFLPDIIKPGDTLGIEAVGNDIDRDNVIMQFEWTLNDQPAGRGQSIQGILKRGDKIKIRVTPYDGEAYGRSVVLNREIENWPPVIIKHNEFEFNNNVYTYQVKAMDPDGDELTYSLLSEQEGVKIDPTTGLLTWAVPSEFKGKKSVTVVVNDGHGGIADYGLNLTVN